MEQFDKLCEVQSDKASVEVNSTGFSLFLFGGRFLPPLAGSWLTCCLRVNVGGLLLVPVGLLAGR